MLNSSTRSITAQATSVDVSTEKNRWGVILQESAAYYPVILGGLSILGLAYPPLITWFKGYEEPYYCYKQI